MIRTFFTTIAAMSALLLLPGTARAELQCFESSGSTPVVVQNASQCSSISSQAVLFDTANNRWTDPRTGQTVASPIAAEEQRRLEQAAAAEQQQRALIQRIQSTDSANAPFCGGASTNGACNYVPLEPLPVGGNAQTGRDFGAFVAGVFRIFITIGGLFAVVMLTVAGIGYMLSESALDIDKAKNRARAALWGLMLLLGSWLILNTINPNLLRFDLLRTSISDVQNLQNQPAPAAAPANTNTTTGPSPADQADCARQFGSYTQQANGTWQCIVAFLEKENSLV